MEEIELQKVEYYCQNINISSIHNWFLYFRPF